MSHLTAQTADLQTIKIECHVFQMIRSLADVSATYVCYLGASLYLIYLLQ